MKTATVKLVIVLLLTAGYALSLGQGAPSQIDAALLDLSARLGYSVGIGSLSNWRWEQANFPNDALGCPSASSSGSRAILAYKFQLTHKAITYDYRVSNDSALVVYCGLVDPDMAAASAPASSYSNRLCAGGSPDVPYMRSRINAGMDVEVLGGYLNMRGQPSTAAQVLLQIPAGRLVSITGGPECVDGYVWWLALVNGQTGYIAESGEGGYLVAPKPPPAIPSREALTAGLAPYLLEFGRVSGNFQPAHDWSRDNRYLIAPGAVGSDGVWVYDLHRPNLVPQILELDEGIAALAVRPHHDQFVVGSEAGALQLWQIHDSDPLTFSERLRLNAHAGPVSAVAFSPDGERLASAGFEAYTNWRGERDFAAIVWDLPTVTQQAVLSGHTGLINAFAFNADAGFIATGANDGAMRNWGASSGMSSWNRDFGVPVTALDYHGELYAVAVARPSDNLLIIDPAGFDRLASYNLPTDGVTSLDFSPDGAMLVVGAAEGLLSIWDTQTYELVATRETDGGIYDISFSPDGTLIAVSTDRHALILYGVPQGSG